MSFVSPELKKKHILRRSQLFNLIKITKTNGIMKIFISHWLQNCVTVEMSLNRPLHSEDCRVCLKDPQKAVTLAQIIGVKHIKSNGFALFISPSSQMCACPSARISRGLLCSSPWPFITVSQDPHTLAQDGHGIEEIVGGIIEP